MEPIITFENYSFRYHAQAEPTIQDINLTIYPGEKVLIIGPSGSGKSTLAHCINGLVPFSYPGESHGTCLIGGERPEDLGIWGLAKKVGTVLQDTDGQFIGLTVAEDIAFVLENDCVEGSQMHRRVDEVAGLLHLKGLLDSAPGELSGGQKQRVSMAGVMIDDVDILLFDEPLANLDPATGKDAIAFIDELSRQENKTVIIIEHRLEDVLYRSVDRILLIGEGRIMADMTPDEMLATNVLAGQGIREPLYISALKHAGCKLLTSHHPASIETMDFAPFASNVQAWFRQATPRAIKPLGTEVLSVEHVGFSYDGKKQILKDIHFQVRKGEMLSIVGRNGAGKTTLSSLICGFIQPTKGRILLNGADIAPLSIKERGEHIGLVMQNPNQMISKAMLYDEVALGLKVRGVPEDEIRNRVLETLKICGLYPYRNWPISALSFGQKKRVTIASILVMQPEIMILDEPTAGQDYRHYTEMMEFLRHINQDFHTTILMITHDMHLMLEYTDRAIAIADGCQIADDTPARILTNAEISKRASLKQTSLYEMALRCRISTPSEFAECFIDYERRAKDGEASIL